MLAPSSCSCWAKWWVMKFMMLLESVNTIPGTFLHSIDLTGASTISKIAPVLPSARILPMGFPTNRSGRDFPSPLGAPSTKLAETYTAVLPCNILLWACPQIPVASLSWHLKLTVPGLRVFGSIKGHFEFRCVQDKHITHPLSSSITLVSLRRA